MLAESKRLEQIYNDYISLTEIFQNLNKEMINENWISVVQKRINIFLILHSSTLKKQNSKTHHSNSIMYFYSDISDSVNVLKHLFFDQTVSFIDPKDILKNENALKDITMLKYRLKNVDFLYSEAQHALENAKNGRGKKGYGVDEKTGKPLTKTDYILSKTVLGILAFLIGSFFILLIIAFITSIFEELAIAIYIVGGIAGLYAVISLTIFLIKRG